MSTINSSVSIVIPTHNRCASLKRLLDQLARQTYPADLMQVIVAVDGSTDDTIRLLQEYKAPYLLQYVESEGAGPAVARNRGAEMAKGKVLLLLDDDVDPCEELVEAHMQVHVNDKIVVIGYLPFPVEGKADLFKQSLRAWWEQKYFRMQNAGYRFSHEDFLTGNVSLSLALFKKVRGFNETLRCREDYELGIRLMKEQAEFFFSKKAWGYHRDEVTNFSRSLSRKLSEGKADVQCWRLHPDVITSLQRAYVSDSYIPMSPKLLAFIAKYPKLTDLVAKQLSPLANLFERLRIRGRWRYYNLRLHNYWYLRGLLGELQSYEGLKNYLSHDHSKYVQKRMLKLDVKEGIIAAESLLDQARPSGVALYYGNTLLGRIPCEPNREALQGRHLRYLLATQFFYPLMKAEALQQLIGEQIQPAFSRSDPWESDKMLQTWPSKYLSLI